MSRDFFAFFYRLQAYGVLFLRLAMGVFLIYGVQDSILHRERMLEFRDNQQVHSMCYPLVAAQLSVYTQLLVGLMLLLGWGVRPACCSTSTLRLPSLSCTSGNIIRQQNYAALAFSIFLMRLAQSQ